MRIIIAIFEDVPFLILNLFLLLSQPDLANNVVFMVSEVFVGRLEIYGVSLLYIYSDTRNDWL